MLRLEAWEFAIEVAGVEQIILDRLGSAGEPLAGHDQGNAGRVRDHHDGEDAVHQIVDLDALDAAAHKPLIGIDGAHRNLGQGRVDLALRAWEIVLAIGLVDLRAEILEAQSFHRPRDAPRPAPAVRGSAGHWRRRDP